MNNFTVYSKPGCPYCTKIKKVLELTNQNYVEYVLDENFTRKEFYDQFGDFATFPQVVLNEIHLGGCTNTIKYLQEKDLV